jgi:xylulokinase
VACPVRGDLAESHKEMPLMPGDLLMGVDIGTSSTKTVLVDLDGRLLSQASREYSFDTPRPGWAEQDAEAWFRAVVATMRQALTGSAVSRERVAAVGLSGQMHGTVCLDKAGRPLRPAIIWADQRSARQVVYLYRRLGREKLGEWTANPLDTGFMLATWLWLREHEPHTHHATAHLLLPKDYVRYRLTDRLGSEPSDASGTLLFDTVRREWSAPLLETLKVDPRLLPPLQESASIAGGLRGEVAEAVGLMPGTPVVHGGGDQAMQALGHGVIQPGTVSCTIGTGGQLFAPLPRPLYDPSLRVHLFCHALPDCWHLLAATLSAGLSLKWLRDRVFQGKSYQALADMAVEVPPGAEGLLFLPHLAGERTPYMDPAATGAFFGLKLRHHRGHLVRAVMEGVVLALRQGFELLVDLGAPVEEVVASGGGTRHPLWLQLQADILNRPIHRTQTVEAAAVGAALLAGVGAGFYADARAACGRAVRRGSEVIQPIPENVARYDALYETHCRLYPAVKTALRPDERRVANA